MTVKELLHTLFPGKEEKSGPESAPAAPPPPAEAALPPQQEDTVPLVQEIPAPPAGSEEDPRRMAALRAELEALRREKRTRLLREEAEALLTRQGLDAGFAPFVLGEDAAGTRQRAEQFQRLFARALRQELSRRPAPQEPRDLSLPAAGPARRPGVRRRP